MTNLNAPFVSCQSAMEVAAGLIHVTTKHPGEYLEVQIVRTNDAADMKEPRQLQVKFHPAGLHGAYTWDDEGRETAHCITPDGQLVDIDLGQPGNGRETDLAHITIVE